MSQELTLEDKLKYLPAMGVMPMLEGGIPNGLDALTGGIATCCGSIHITEEAKRVTMWKEYTRRIWWQKGKDIPSSSGKGSESLLIPDVLGNVLIEWEDV